MTRSKILQFETKRFPTLSKQYLILGYISIPTGVFSGKWVIVQEGEKYIKCPKPDKLVLSLEPYNIPKEGGGYSFEKFTLGRMSFLNSKYNVSLSPNTSSTDDVNLDYLDKLSNYIRQANMAEQIFY